MISSLWQRGPSPFLRSYSLLLNLLIAFLNPFLLASLTSVYRYRQNHFHRLYGIYSATYFNADQLNTNEAQLLKLEPNDPCLRYHQTFYTTTGIPFDASDIVFHYKNAHFYIPSKMHAGTA
ncbi:UTRA domain-containing protein [Staphylococcus pseudintermedius]|uniref:UTRA domain-containing protein n=1 Tax=Staphylococcus pseudintermedius TaxID=283734 RepID=UPI002158552E|nr:UTRA domain-containing protein [Staphylococcus pseudintermedius]MDK4170654.1 UTRA domain-containing protein [Staphylococcus pseudintermedius]